MPMYLPKPVAVEARQWDGTQAQAADLIAWIQAGGMLAYYEILDGTGRIVINTSNGPNYTNPTDWIVNGPAGFKPCPADAFDLAYEPADP